MLSKYVTPEGFDYDSLGEDIAIAVRFLDNVLDVSEFATEGQKESVRNKFRQIGLGIMGWSDALKVLKVPYDSINHLSLITKVGSFFANEAYRASEALAEEKGACGVWDEIKDVVTGNEFERWNAGKTCQVPRRNSTVLSIAPTGSIAQLAACSWAFEPDFGLSIWKQVFVDASTSHQQWVQILNPYVEELGLSEDDKWVVLSTGSLQKTQFAKDNPEVAAVYRIASEVTFEWHIKVQSEWQKWIDSSISKCIAAGTLIPTSKGLIPVEAFSGVDEDDKFESVKDDIYVDGFQVLSHYRAGLKPATKITLDNGASLTAATQSHQVMTVDGWKKMHELRVGDLVLGKFLESHGEGGLPLAWESAYRSNAKKILVPDRMTPDFACFLGMLAADGHTILSTGNVGLTSKDAEVEQEFITLCLNIFGVTPQIIEDKRNQVRYVYLTSRNLVRFIESLIGKGAYNKVVPDVILQGSKEEKLAFLRGITLDGYAWPQGLCVYAGMSEQLAYQVSELCRSFGLPKVYLGTKVVQGYGVCHYVSVSNEMQSLIQCIESRKNIEPVMQTYNVFVGQDAVSSTKLPSNHPHYSALRNLKQRGMEHCENGTAAKLGWQSEILVHRITKIEDAGMVEMYDIEVDQSHAYVVNGMISHNTINLPKDATVEDIKKAYLMANEMGLKGVTVYRAGTLESEPIKVGDSNQQNEKPEDEYKSGCKSGMCEI